MSWIIGIFLITSISIIYFGEKRLGTLGKNGGFSLGVFTMVAIAILLFLTQTG